MSTEAVVCVSLALVLLTRIYVFISQPEFLEEHRDRRYHEYNLYRQYHIHKQFDKSDPDHKRLIQDKNDDTSSLHSSSSTPNSRRRGTTTTIDSDTPLEGLYPSDELILLSAHSGSSRPLPLHQLSLAGLDAHDISLLSNSPLSPSSHSFPHSSPPNPTSPRSPRESKGLWSRILGSSDSSDNEPGYISLDINEINYNGSLSEFVHDSEVQETIQGLKAGVRDMTKECPTMTMVWESGRWCCLEGRTLYILRALEWKGQVRVRVLVDKDPMTLAVTEDYWKTTVMGSELGLLTPPMSSSNSSTSTSAFTSPSHLVTPTTTTSSLQDSDLKGRNIVEHSINSAQSRFQMSAAKVEYGASTIGVSLEEPQQQQQQQDHHQEEKEQVSTKGHLERLGMYTTESLSFPGTPTGHDADDEGDEHDDDEDDEVESDGYMEDDEGDEDEEEDDEEEIRVKGIEQRFGTIELDSRGLEHERQRKYITEMQARHGGKFGNGVARLKLGENIKKKENNQQQQPNNKIEITKTKIKGNGHEKMVSLKGMNHHPDNNNNNNLSNNNNHRHERKISIPEFMLPPPLNDERAYLIIDPSFTGKIMVSAADGARENPVRRDSGHGASP